MRFSGHMTDCRSAATSALICESMLPPADRRAAAQHLVTGIYAHTHRYLQLIQAARSRLSSRWRSAERRISSSFKSGGSYKLIIINKFLNDVWSRVSSVATFCIFDVILGATFIFNVTFSLVSLEISCGVTREYSRTSTVWLPAPRRETDACEKSKAGTRPTPSIKTTLKNVTLLEFMWLFCSLTAPPVEQEAHAAGALEYIRCSQCKFWGQ